MNSTRIRKRKKETNFTVLDNTCIRDDRVSWKAKGLHTYIESLPDDWIIYAKELVNHAPDGEKTVYAIIKELQSLGYLEAVKLRNECGHFQGVEYVINEIPKFDPDTGDTKTPCAENRHAVNRHTGERHAVGRHAENRHLLNTNNTKNLKELTTNSKEGDSKVQSETENESTLVRESVFCKSVKSIFNESYPFDVSFESDVLRHMDVHNLDGSLTQEFLSYVFEQTKQLK